MGILTAEQGIEAIQTNTLPETDVMVSQQQEYKQQRDGGLYAPLVAQIQQETALQTAKMGMQTAKLGAKTKEGTDGNSAGRPSGTKAPQTQKTISPIGTSKASEVVEKKFSLKKITENFILAQELEKLVTTEVKSLHNIKRLNKLQKSVIDGIVNTVIANEDKSQWLSVAKEYSTNPIDKNPKRAIEVNKLGETHLLEPYLAGILSHSIKDEE
jgi:hypothetical protein